VLHDDLANVAYERTSRREFSINVLGKDDPPNASLQIVMFIHTSAMIRWTGRIQRGIRGNAISKCINHPVPRRRRPLPLPAHTFRECIQGQQE
jgi:hypothetical protein